MNVNLKDKIEDILPLTPLQKGLLFHSLYELESGVYFQQLNCRLEGNVSVDAVNQAWQTLINRHQILRTAFITKGQKEPIQVVFKELAFQIEQQDWSGLSQTDLNKRLDDFLTADRHRGFILDQPPLMRVTLIRLSQTSWHLIWSHHHLLLDGWSQTPLMQEFFYLHQAAQQGKEISLPPVRPYKDFLAWLKQKNPDDAETFWRNYMKGFSSHTPLVMMPARQRTTSRGKVELRLKLDRAETASIEKLARYCQVTLNTVIQGTWAILLNRYSRSEDIVFGITVAGRPTELKGIERTVGPFINTLPLRVLVSGAERLDLWLQKLQQQQVEMRQYEHSSLSNIQGWSDVPRGQSLFESLLAFENFPFDKSLKAENFGLDVTEISFWETTHYPLTVAVVPEEELLFKLTYSSEIFDHVGMELLLQHWKNLLINAANNYDAFLSSLSLFASRELPAAIEPQTQIRSDGTTLASRFAASASKYSNRVALAWGEGNLTYEEIDLLSNQMARFLQEQGIEPEKPVVLFLERSWELIVAMLGVVKAGGVYVPVDPAYPVQRIKFIVSDCQTELILTSTALVSLLPKSVPAICLDQENAPYKQVSSKPVIAPTLQPENGAYIMYTSGSTGQPKGVVVTHNNVTRLFSSTEHWFEFNCQDVWTFFHSCGFDISAWEIWGAFLYGGRLEIVPYQVSRDPKRFLELIRDRQVTVLNQTPSAFLQLLLAEEQLPTLQPTTLRLIILAGEALNLSSLQPWFDRHGEETTRIVNMYGITETTVYVTYRPISRQDVENISASVIGEPIPDLSVYVVDANGHLLPPGVTGEIYVGGAGVARCYLNRPEENALRFMVDRFSGDDNRRLYRTGDLARFLPDGDLEYLGRIDQQVKIRGFRIEIGEIEAAIAKVSEVKENIVVLREDANHEKHLIAYLVCSVDRKPTIESLRTHLQQYIPDYAIPSHFVYLDQLPLTVNGKADRRALPDPEIDRSHLNTNFVAPVTKQEEILAQIWQKVLGVDKVGRFDNYFVIGGDSIRSIRVCSLAEAEGLKVEISQIFSFPVLADLAAAITPDTEKASINKLEQPFALISSEDRAKLEKMGGVVDAYPLTQLQMGMLFHSHYTAKSTAYNDVFSFRVRSHFNFELWQQAYAQVLAKHPVLRTAFYLGEFSEPLQIIFDNVSAKSQFTDLTDKSELERENYFKSFLTKGFKTQFDWQKAPLMRCHIHLLDHDLVEASFAVHHGILDGWSLANFITELTSLYFHLLEGKATITLPLEPKISYAQFVALEREAIKDRKQREFWQEQLTGIPFTRLPRIPGIKKPGLGKINVTLNEEIAQNLRLLARELGIPIKTILLAVHLRLLAFCAGENEVVTGLVTNGRPEVEGGDRILGLFVNTIPFRLELPKGSWLDLIRATWNYEQNLMPYRRFPLAEIQRIYQNQPIYETSFNFVHFHVYQKLLNSSEIEIVGSESLKETNIPLNVTWNEDVSTKELHFNITYDSNEFGKHQVEAMVDYVLKVCAVLADDPKANYSNAIKNLVLPENNQLELNPSPTVWVHEIFTQVAATNPDLPAVSYQGEIWTNKQLNQKANQLAGFLRDRGIGSECNVGICLERSLEMVWAILAVVKAGGCYVPLDPDYPDDRIQSIIADAQIKIILTTSNLAVDYGDNSKDQVIFLDNSQDEIASHSAENLDIPIRGENTAYLIFTSGSTGRAKGIAITHHALAKHMEWFVQAFAVNKTDVILQKTPFGFDASVWEFWAALMTGAKLVMAKPGGHQESNYLVETIKAEKVTLLQVVPTLLEILLQEPGFAQCSSLRLVFSGGEVLKQRVWNKFRTNLPVPLVNLYGPAETTIDVAYHFCQEQESTDTIAIGKSVPNTRLYVLDTNLEPVMIGTPGELFVAGEQLARGYWDAPQLSAASFLPDPFSDQPGSRMYRTGDSARYLPDGTLEFLGRLDRQMKIRGIRIEPGEIIAAIEAQSWIVRAAVKGVILEEGINQLVAYVELNQAPEDWQIRLRSSLKQVLPDFMMPSLFVPLQNWPLLVNGKIDLNALPLPQLENTALQRQYVAPQNETQRILAEIWERVLRISPIGIEDDFFELGGDSLLAMQIVAKARVIGIYFTPSDLFNYSRIVELTAQIGRAKTVADTQTISVTGEIPLTPIQEWFFKQPLIRPEHWNQAVLLNLKPQFPVEQLEKTLLQIAKKHPAFSLRFSRTANGWKQELVPESNLLGFDKIDLRTLPDAEIPTQITTIANQFQAQLDLERGLLFRAVYFQTKVQDKLLLIIHHLIVDGVSWRVILQDLAMDVMPRQFAGFDQWALQLERLSQNYQNRENLHFWQQQKVENFSLPLDFPDAISGNKESSSAEVECNFSQDETASLLYELPRTSEAKIQEVLLTALLRAVTDWTNRSEVAIALESHGRDSDFSNLEVFDAVGWFTSLFPLRLEKSSDDHLANLAAIKEQFQKLPHKGLDYGILSRQPEVAPTLPAIPQGIIFNYLGQFDDNFPATAPFSPADEDTGFSRNQDEIRPFQLEIIGLIVNEQLQIRFVYSKNLHLQATIEKLANNFYQHTLALLTASRSQEDVSNRTETEDIYPLTPVQEGILFHSNYESSQGLYLQQLIGDIEGILDIAAFQKAWQCCVERHPSLRAAFIWQDLEQPQQQIQRQVTLPFISYDWSNEDEIEKKWAKLLETDRQEGFALDTAPLMRFLLVKLEQRKWRFLWTHHHLLLDGWSLPIVFRDAIAFYQVETTGIPHQLPEPPLYRKFIHWLQQQKSALAESFWKSAMRGLLGATRLGLKAASTEHQTYSQTLSQQTYTQLKTAARKYRVTLNVLVQAAWSILLSKYSSSNDVVYGITVSGRPPELANSEEMVGLFINTLPLRVHLNNAEPVVDWLPTIRDRQLEINQYSYSRLVDIQGWSEIPRGQPLFESILIYENYPIADSLGENTGDLAIASVRSLEKNNYPVTVYVLPGREITIEIAFQQGVGSSEQRQQLLTHLITILEKLADPELEFIGEIGLSRIQPAESKRDVPFTDKASETFSLNSPIPNPQSPIPNPTVNELFSRQVLLTPDAPAVFSGANWLTYAELEHQSDQIAHQLLVLGVKPETPVAVCLERHPKIVVALLGILKAGAAFVPLDPEFPRDRLDYILSDSGAAVIVTETSIALEIPESSARVLLIDSDNLTVTDTKPTLPEISESDRLAYIIYTSGSTGRPKGVEISHNCLVNFLLSFQKQPGITSTDTLVAVTTLSFDISLLELFLPLISGARLVIADPETTRDGGKLAQLLKSSEATVMQATPATWRLLLTANWQPQLPFKAFCGGEAMSVELATSLLKQGVELWNVYGPTETTIWSAINPVKQVEDSVSIGQGITKTSLYILDSAGHPVPEGVVGELFISGAGLARGYRNRADLTAEKFVPNPFGSNPGERMYQTGDLGRFLSDGTIEFLGRSDFQVKVRGFRIELGEIETVLETHPAISQAIVSAVEDRGGDKQLVAYLVATLLREQPSPEDLRSYLSTKLPAYMLPSSWIFLEQIPLTLNQKVDRRALPLPSIPDTTANYVAPRNAIEEALVLIWQEILQVEKVGVKDNFFELGGHSLIASQIYARIEKIFAINLSLRELFESQTIEKITEIFVSRERTSGQSEKIAKVFLRMKKMTPEEKAELFQNKNRKNH
ncbi:non-ribosomal peptide synthetase [Aetokthonos hydrillicola Thurmond2011]|jgi:amino acid adenylation domain-containing protein/non-ribosomal peptide synthase protein (TIGR01720 family)|uniref:Non-ribosomal peptide synthetase n=1 Tax=Aetokthonos hydrillicola Thurmond2011 TaxID=2712845 RepID=A0AAP5I996_9CYAN|nr:non-ribosomal peptide synthetase [Aetokthonos hydrillicola]MBO3458681.1 amino acid adenylation domain-containing protein [Aetokthonos hydrillicola CCALA 1050]MBW4588034.1 amino acid adenylation domain-containing protein [Aetokthonos hydrillicola CCALA 1050]MDR9897014.1 non-ribosomal peptide synthetase [Aetokthonos hydrillicola Thurmond2011]